MRIFIPEVPDHIVDITTNSSSEIFVMSKGAEVNSVEKVIEDLEVRWWMGEPKKIETMEDVNKFMEDFGHVADHLFGWTDHPQNSEYDFYGGKSNPIWKAQYKEWDKKMKKVQDARPNDDTSRDSIKWESWRERMSKLWEERKALRNSHMQEWLSHQDTQSLIGMVYYECGEDNELGFELYENLHAALPGKTARLS